MLIALVWSACVFERAVVPARVRATQRSTELNNRWHSERNMDARPAKAKPGEEIEYRAQVEPSMYAHPGERLNAKPYERLEASWHTHTVTYIVALQTDQ